MAGAGIAAKKNWGIRTSRGLQSRRYFAGLSRVDPPIIFARGQQNSGVFDSVPHMVMRRVAIEGLELRRIFDRAELGDVKLTVRIEFHTEHIINADMRNDCASEIRTLGQERAHEQSTITSA